MSRSNDCYDAIPYAERIGIPLVVETQEGGGMPAAATTPQSGASVVRVHTVVSSTALLAFAGDICLEELDSGVVLRGETNVIFDV